MTHLVKQNNIWKLLFYGFAWGLFFSNLQLLIVLMGMGGPIVLATGLIDIAKPILHLWWPVTASIILVTIALKKMNNDLFYIACVMGCGFLLMLFFDYVFPSLASFYDMNIPYNNISHKIADNRILYQLKVSFWITAYIFAGMYFHLACKWFLNRLNKAEKIRAKKLKKNK